MKILLLIFLCNLYLIKSSFATETPTAFKLFDGDGSEAEFETLVNAALEADIILFGEIHNNPLSHWFRLELVEKLFEKTDKKMLIGTEVIERDDQGIMDEYRKGLIEERHFEREARLWQNYQTDYKPLINYALTNEITVFGSNVPRRYAAMVAGGGFEALDKLSATALIYIAPLPIPFDIELPTYQKILEMSHGHANENFIKAQAIKDATMAHFITEYCEVGDLCFHFNGAFHSDYHEGIAWYLQQYAPDLNVLVISTKEQETIAELNEAYLQSGDFILLIPANMTKTY